MFHCKNKLEHTLSHGLDRDISQYIDDLTRPSRPQYTSPCSATWRPRRNSSGVRIRRGLHAYGRSRKRPLTLLSEQR